MCATMMREQTRKSFAGNAAETAETFLCRYCFNLDHWVPARLITVERECKHCTGCPMYVPLHEWEEHEAHNPEGTDAPIVLCAECPVCSGLIPPAEPQVECHFCNQCQAYVPVTLWDRHVRQGCYGQEDPFA